MATYPYNLSRVVKSVGKAAVVVVGVETWRLGTLEKGFPSKR